MSAWTPEDHATLIQCAVDGLSAAEAAEVLDRTEAACSTRASKHKIGFNSTRHSGLRLFLEAGGRLIREDVGGAVGVRWAAAHRSAGSFDATVCERLLEIGRIVPDTRGVYRGRYEA